MRADAGNPNFKPTLEKAEKPKSMTSNIDLIKDKIKREEMKMERIKEAYEDGIDSLDEYKANKIKITAVLDELRNKLQAEMSAIGDTADKIDYSAFKDRLTSVVNIISAADVTPEAFNDALLSIVSKIVFDRKKTQIDIVYKG